MNAFSTWLAGLSREEYEQVLDTWGEKVKATAVTAAPDTALLVTIQQELHKHNRAEEDTTSIIYFPKTLLKNRRWLHYSAAAAIIIAVLISTYFLVDTRLRRKDNTIATTAVPIAIPPGSNKAVLILANGQQLLLDDAKQGNVGNQDGVKIIKINNGLVAYHAGTAKPGETQYNTISTPRGGQYQLILPDGTHAWLNAASSLRFPVVFNGRERKVELWGEGYFDVVHDAAHPFIVSFRQQEVQVLGTEFNVMAYEDEAATQTTLVQGSVRLNGTHPVTLQPGTMAVADGNAQHPVNVHTADIEQVTAWKNGKISLTNADLGTLMRGISRWYNVNVHYTGAVPDKHFFGLINRNVYLSSILDFLKKNGVQLQQNGRDITIMP